MHQSIIYIDGENECNSFKVSYLFSERLFSIGFWSKVNNSLETLFDQYESQSIEGELLSSLISIFSELKSEIINLNVEVIKFTRGWTQDGKPIEVDITKTDMIESVDKLTKFSIDALHNNKRLIFDL